MRALAIALALVTGCTTGRTGPGGDNGGNNGNNNNGTFPVGSFGAQCNGQRTALTGVAYAPNGGDPVASAHVYIVAQTNPFGAGVSCEVCGAPIDTALAETTSGPDGRFTLSLDQAQAAATVKLVVAKGRFRHAADLNVTACASSPVDKPLTTLPGRSSDGDVPKIAVATGSKATRLKGGIRVRACSGRTYHSARAW